MWEEGGNQNRQWLHKREREGGREREREGERERGDLPTTMREN